MKKISIVIPTYNEEANISRLYERVRNIFSEKLNNYLYEIIFIDNDSSDNTREIIRQLCGKDINVKAIFNAKNFGFTRSTYYGLLQGSGECTVLLFADMQDPPELIIEFVRCWEEGSKIVTGIKNKSKENKIMFFIRKMYYKFLKAISNVEQIEQFTGFGLYDAEFIRLLKSLKDSAPYLRGIVAEFGTDRKEVYYIQDRREFGKSSFHFWNLYDTAMLGITSYSKVLMRLATISGFIMSIVCFFLGLITIIFKLCNWQKYQIGMAAVLVGIFFLGAVLLFFVGIQGEYILNMNTRIINRPLVIAKEKINFDAESTEDK